MKRILLSVAVCGGIIYLSACHSSSQKEAGEAQQAATLPAATPSDLFNARMDTALGVYYRLKDAFFAGDTGRADQVAGLLRTAIDSLPLQMIASDTARYNQVHVTVGSLRGEIAGLQGENTVKNKQREFSMVSDMMYDLIKATGLKSQTVYREFCPMAFEGKGAYWLSDKAKIENPYYGRQMPDCGEVKETLKF